MEEVMKRTLVLVCVLAIVVSIAGSAGAINESRNPYYPQRPADDWVLVKILPGTYAGYTDFNATTNLHSIMVWDHRTNTEYSAHWAEGGCPDVRDGFVKTFEQNGLHFVTLRDLPRGWSCDPDWT